MCESFAEALAQVRFDLNYVGFKFYSRESLRGHSLGFDLNYVGFKLSQRC